MHAQIKFMGMILIVASCSGLGLQLAHLYRLRIRQCRQVEQGLQRLLGEIRFHRVTLEEALRETGQAMEKGPFAQFLIRVAERLAGHDSRNQNGRSEDTDGHMSWTMPCSNLGQVWQQEGKRYVETSLLQEEQEILLALGQELGTLDMEEQIRSLQQCLEQWHQHMALLQSREETHGRLCRGIGISAGVFLAILLL